MTRFSVAVRTGRRGAGLGNELFALAKAHIAARLTDSRLVEQPWWLNERRYGRDMGWNLVKPMQAQAARLRLATVHVTEEDLVGSLFYEDVVKRIHTALPDQFVLLHDSRQAGGYLSISSARSFLRTRLGLRVASTNPVDRTFQVGIHLRFGDFSAGQVKPGTFNVRLGTEWSLDAARSLARALNREIQFVVVSDAEGPDRQSVEAFGHSLESSGIVKRQHGTALEDLRALASCDVIVPSVSSFSTSAIFLSGARYVWPSHHLVRYGDYGSIWGFEGRGAASKASRIALKATETRELSANPRGLAYAVGQADELEQWIASAEESEGDWNWRGDLIMYGVSPVV